VGTGEDGSPAAIGPITEGAFLSNTDTINGYSGAPLFDAAGRWIGINVTVYGADPREGYSDAMRAVHLKSEAVIDALERAGLEARSGQD
jgi:hypothetical protein